MQKVSQFSRTADNFANKGQYFTCPLHSKAIGRLIQWPDNEVSVLEPSIGDASAVLSFLDGRSATTFGVELDNGIYNTHREEGKIDYILNADFLTGITASNSAFSLCFCNPPYGDSEYNERYESLFMKRIYNYLKTKGLIVLIIPYYIFQKDPKMADKFTRRYSLRALYKFHDKEFRRYRQIVLIGEKKPALTDDHQASLGLQESVEDIDNLPLLPLEEDFERERIRLISSPSENVNLFQTNETNLEELKTCYRFGHGSGVLERTLSPCLKKNGEVELTPPIPPKNGHLFLLGTTGFTSGPIGSPEKEDVHLQRGKVNVTKITSDETKPSGKVVQTTKCIRSTSMVLIESSGKITRF